MIDIFNFVVFWVQRHPIPVAAGVVCIFVLTWLLNRKSSLDRENDRIVKNLVESSKDKYKDTRPLR